LEPGNQLTLLLEAEEVTQFREVKEMTQPRGMEEVTKFRGAEASLRQHLRLSYGFQKGFG
jgi:hypothetical protein